MMYRQVKRFIRARPIILGILINNILWVTLFGLGMATTLRSVSGFLLKGLDYIAFLLPAMFITSVFQASFMGGISVIWDKQFGFLKEVLVSPVSRSLTILGRAVGDTINALINALIMLSLGFILTDKLNPTAMPLVITIGFLVGLGFTSLGIAIASVMRNPEGFQLIVGAITMPITMLSGAMFPLHMAPTWMKIIALASPLTYAVDLSRYLLTGISILGDVYPWLTSSLQTSILLALTTIFMTIAIKTFERTTID